MSLSSRFAEMPAPKYDSMQVKAKVAMPTRSTRDALLDAPLGAGPKIIRPNVNGNKRKRKQDPMIAKRQQQQQNGGSTADWSDFRSQNNGNGNGATQNRGRGFNKSQQSEQGQGGGYKSYRTSGAPRGDPMNNAPYRRPQQNRQRARQLPPYQGGQQQRQQQRQQGRQQGRQNGRGSNDKCNSCGGVGHWARDCVSQQNGQRGQGQRQRKVNPKFKNKNGGGQGQSKTFAFKKGGKGGKGKAMNAESMDKELEAYHMKNLSVEERKAANEGNLDKDLDDYFKTQGQAQVQSEESAPAAEAKEQSNGSAVSESANVST